MTTEAKAITRNPQEFPELLFVSRLAGKAIVDYGMLQDGDRVAVAVSGGKDSISLLHVLRHRQKIAPIHFDFMAVHVDFDFPDFSPQSLIDYLKRESFPYHVEKVDFLKGKTYQEIDCFWWSRQRRKALFILAERMGFNKIAFGHHMDDIAETILLNQFYRGEIGAMKPRQELFAGKITVIRPLAYVREETMRQLAELLGIRTVTQSKCANDDISHRMVIKQLLREMEKTNPQVVKNIFRSLQNIRGEYLLETVGPSE